MNEIWKPIPNYEGLYEASSLGRIRSVDRVVKGYSFRGKRPILLRRKGRMLVLNAGRLGYKLVSLSKNGKAKTRRVSRLVCFAFHGHPKPNMQVCHNDGNSSNDRIENLRWGTAKENQADRIIHGTDVRGEAVKNSFLTADDVAKIRASKTYGTLKGVAVSKTHYHRIKNRVAWAHV